MSTVDDIVEKASKRLAEIETEAAALRAIIQAAGGTLPALPPTVNQPQFLPMPYPVPQVWPGMPYNPFDPFGPVCRIALDNTACTPFEFQTLGGGGKSFQ